MSTLALPPPSLAQDDLVQAARQRVTPNRKRLSVSLPNLKAVLHRSSKSKQEPPPVQDEPLTTEYHETGAPQGAITFDNVSTNVNYDPFQDVYQWAVLYENQRGMTIFSIPLYSSSALLPTDPAPFTIPTSSPQSRSHLPNVSINEYPLPDGNWRWVSNSWMIDMRYSGEVQYDGFEYNWNFRQRHWRPDVGLLNAGGWVRRRRWIRLMMRPGLKRRTALGDENMQTPVSTTSRRSSWNADSFDARKPPTGAPSMLSVSTMLGSTEEILEMWSGDVEEDWKMCRQMMKVIGRSDGGRLELWKRWLGLTMEDVKGKGKQKLDDTQDTDEDPIALRNCVKAVFDAHGSEILQLFVYPESKRRFVELLTEAGIHLQDTDGSLLRALQFHSLSSGLNLHASVDGNDFSI